MANQSSYLTVFCRQGFETEVIDECSDYFGHEAKTAYCEDGFVIIETTLDKKLRVHDLIFARQIFWMSERPKQIKTENRADPLCTASAYTLQTLFEANMCSACMWELVDSNHGKELSHTAKALTGPVITRLKKLNLIWNSGKGPKTAPTLHIVPLQNHFYCIGASLPGSSSPFPAGIEHLKTPRDAPSRSLLKLEEAFKLSNIKQSLKENFSAVDLGAAPGGWSYYLVQQGGKVAAVDNGELTFQHPNLSHVKANALGFRPKHKIELLVCDIVEKPLLITNLAKQWIESGWCKQAIFNLKLPMRKRYNEVKKCIGILKPVAVEQNLQLKVKQLYHDREEVTVIMTSM